MIPSTVGRVPEQTAPHLNKWIKEQTRRRVARLAESGKRAIDGRLQELDQEWDIERTLEANAATAVLVGVTLGASVDRRWFFFPAVVGGFLLQHAIQGWCPPLFLFPGWGFALKLKLTTSDMPSKPSVGTFAAQVKAAKVTRIKPSRQPPLKIFG